MKLSSKTLYFFISVIIFQSSLTIFFITSITKRNNLEDAAKELGNEAALVFESYNSWKRRIWKSLISIQKDDGLADISANYRGISSKSTLTEYLTEMLRVSGVNYFVLKSSSGPEPDITPITITPNNYNIFALSDFRSLENRKPHPYLELKLTGNILTLIGTTRLTMSPDFYLDVFIIKNIDDDFCRQLTFNRRSRASFFLDDRYLIGAFHEKTLSESYSIMNLDSPYKEIYNIEIEKDIYNIAVQKTEKIIFADGVRNLFLVTILSNYPYLSRLVIIEKTVLYVSVISAILSIILSLFLSRNITRPVKDLLNATSRIKSGKFDTTIKIKSRNEIGELFRGFNEMALKLRQDKTTMESYIHEITILKEYNEKIIHSIQAGIAIINRDLDIEMANRSFFEQFNLDGKNVIGKKVTDLDLDIIDSSILNNIKAVLKKNNESFSKIKRAENKKIYEIKLYPFYSSDEHGAETSGCVFISDDISSKIELEEKIFQAEKLSTISMLSAGVAHEINNPLSSIMTNVQNLIDDERNQDKKASLKWIEQETRRIARIVQELLDFSSSASESNSGSDANKVISEAITLIKYSLKKKKGIEIKTDLEEGIPLTVISQDELKQVIINLIKNSIQAMEDGGSITVRTRPGAEDKKIRITVEDNGTGINEKIIPRIFDPFFTTKRNGEGTGLGLSVVYGIINKYYGTIKVSNKDGKGTVMTLAIPVLEDR